MSDSGALYFVSPGKQFNAIFGGNITGRRLTGVKINPLFLEGQSEEDVRQTESLGRNGLRRKDPGIRLNVYDLRSPAHSIHGENGKRQTIVKIGGHEILSVSSTNGIHEKSQIGDVTDVAVTFPGDTSNHTPADVKVNGDNHHDHSKSSDSNHIHSKPDNKSTFVSVLNRSDLNDYRTNESPYRPPGNGTAPHNHVDRGGTENNGFVMSPEQKEGGRDVQEVVVRFTETADSPVMDTCQPREEEEEWPELPDCVTDGPTSAHESYHTRIYPITKQDNQDGQVSLDELRVNLNSHQTIQSSSDSRALKPILVRSQSSFNTLLSSSRSSSAVLIDETAKEPPKSNMKTVKFADDTIDNENKTKRYMKERIDLIKVYYKGKTPDSLGSANPIFVDEQEVKNVNNNHTVSQPNKQLVDLNVPAYMQKYLAEGSSKDPAGKTKSSTPTPASQLTVTTPVRSSREYHTTVDSEESPGDSSADTEMSEVTGYAALVMKTAVQERRRQAIKWTVITVVVVVILVLAIALPIYFTSKDS